MVRPEEIIINNKTLEQILIEHKHWIYKDCDGWENMKADLHYAHLQGTFLRYANLQGADLFGAHLQCADLSCADLSYTNLYGVNLYDANLCYANLQDADLSHADLRGTRLYSANLCDTNLQGTNFDNADLSYTNLYGVNLYDTKLYATNLCCANLYNAKGNLIKYRRGKILTEDIIGYKKCKDNIIVTLKIPRGAIVFSINGNKCRTNKAKVIAIDGADRAFSYQKYMSYYIGDEITIYDFNCEYNLECAEGIHFFMTKEDAEHYIF